MLWRTRGAATWSWSEDRGPSQLASALADRGYAVCTLDDATRRLVDRPWSFATRLLGERPAMVERQPIQAVAHGRSFASTSGPAPLHSDSQQFAGRPPRLQLMLCTRAARSGGASLLLDTHALLKTIEHSDPNLHTALHREEREIPFVFGAVTGPTVRTSAGETWFTHSPMPPRDEIGERLAAALRRASPVAVTLAPGELLVVDNHRMLHGRTAFTGARAFLRLLVWSHPPKKTPAQHRLDVVLDMLCGAAPGQLATHAQTDEPSLYRWRDRALAAALAALERDDPEP